jgi:HK97 family phage major capsid protein
MDTATQAVLSELKKATSDRTEAWKELDEARTNALDDDGNIRDDKLDELKTFRETYDTKADRVLKLEEKLQIVGGSSIDAPDNPFENPTENKPEARKSLGRQVVDSPQYRDKAGKNYDWSRGFGGVEAKTLLSEAAGSGGTLIQPDVQPGILGILFQPPKVADLLASGTTTSNTVRYLKETTATNAADAVPEGGQKPESTLVFTNVDEPVQKLATFLPVTDEMLEDYDQMASYIDNRLRLFVQLKEDTELLLGTGTAPHMQGILKRTGINTQPKASDTVADAIHKGMTKVRNAFIEPDGLVINPTDWETLVLQKDAVAGQYFGGGPFTGAYGTGGNGVAPTRLWGLNVIITQSITQGTALVGAFRTAAQIFRRSGISVDTSNSHDTFFQYNKVAVRAEERLALAVYRPAGFTNVNGL